MQLIEYQKRMDGNVIKRFNVPVTDANEIDCLLMERARPKAHGNAKAVVIWGPVDEEIYAERIRSHGAQPITGTFFPSSNAASSHFGYQSDAVGYALREAKKRGESMAVVGGVTLRRADDIRD